MKRIFKFLILSLLTTLAVFYIVTAGFLWWSEVTVKTEDVNKSIYVRSQEPHDIELIDDGLLSLKRRIELIDSAKESIDLEFFIYEVDTASKIITQKLVEAAERGIAIRVLVDFSAPVFSLKPAYAQKMKSHNIQVKYYNTSNTLRIVSVQHRSHRKLLIIDNQMAMTGGRNIGDDYFHLSSHYNFLDSDILVSGPAVKTVRESFDLYWNSNYADSPNTDNNDDIAVDSFFKMEPSVQSLLSQIMSLKLEDSEFYKKGVCEDLEFVTDFPGVSIANRQVYRHLSDALGEGKESIYGESPYFVLRKDGLDLLESLSKREIEQNYLTNSLNSTDAFYTVSAMTSSMASLRKAKVNLFVYNGSPPKNMSFLNGIHSHRWGTHSKRAVIDGRHLLIGTYNVDPRSANLNSEVLVICRNSPELAQQTLFSIKNRMENSWPVVENEKTHFSNVIKKAQWSDIFKMLFILPLAELFKFLL